MINLRDLSIKCGRCGVYQTLIDFEPCDGFHRYTFECDEGSDCAADQTRTLLEIPTVLDQFHRKHPDCGGPADDEP